MSIRFLRSLLALATPLGAAGGLAASQSAIGQEYRASAEAPAEWRAYAQRLQGLFKDELSDDDMIRSFAAAGDKAAKQNVPASFTVRAWVAADGKVERLEFSGLDAATTSAVRARLMRTDVGASPPDDMLQPLHLKLSLGDKS